VTKPIVAIVGRPNAGKSTLLNRIVGRRLAITEDLPGTTRDRNLADTAWNGVPFTIVDTGGLELEPGSAIARGIREQIQSAINAADVIIDLVDVSDGVTAADLNIADLLRRAAKPVVVVVNKVDNDRLETDALEFYELGLGEPVTIAAHHGRGVADLLDKIVALLPEPGAAEPPPENVIKVAIAGRPNVGKSALLNALVGDRRAIVDNVPGTTRDAVDTPYLFEGQPMLLIDTAGLRRRGKVGKGIEKYSVLRSREAIERADIVLLVLDATELGTQQDTHVGGYVQDACKGLIIIVNKWDLVEDKNIREWNRQVRSIFRFASYAPIIYTAAISGQGVAKIMPQVVQIYRERLKRLSTATVNDIVERAVASHPRPRKRNKLLNVLYATQADVNPPTFVFFTNDASLVHFSYRRYLENKLREAFGFEGTPLKMVFKTRGEV
jgi:GTP-binding protein